MLPPDTGPEAALSGGLTDRTEADHARHAQLPVPPDEPDDGDAS
jgi:hypothetical protein